jgi:WD40 repeat protein
MSGRFVRASSFRHVFGQPNKPEACFLDVSVQCSGDGNFIASNGTYMAFAGRGGGGPVIILNNDAPRRVGSSAKKLVVHRSKVLDFDWSPFDKSLLATCAEDNLLKVSKIPDGGLTDHQSEELVTLSGHEKKVIGLNWNPNASNIMASAGFDHTAKVWNVETQQVTHSIAHGAELNHIRWNREGTLLATTAKDKLIRVFDPRADEKEVASVAAFGGSKKAGVEFLTAHNMIGCVGFSKSSMRQIKLYDVRNLSKAAHSEDLDQSAGVLIPYYDHDTSMFYVAGKGDSTIKYFEIVGGSPYMHFLSAFADNKSHKGLCFLPKTACDTTKCEVASCLRVMNDSIVPISFVVPRKNADTFQSDIYPDAAAGIAGQSADQWLAGEAAEVILTSMRPGELRSQEGGAALQAKATYAELEAQLAAANARIAELEAQVAGQ